MLASIISNVNKLCEQFGMLFEVLTVSVTEYIGRAESGRSHPMLCRCETDGGDELEVYAK